MCGIVGIIKAIASNLLTSEWSVRWLPLAHRGPDDEGFYFRGRCARDAAPVNIDVDGGHQPISNEDGTVWVVFNGEIYNFATLRESLGRGHQFRRRYE